MSVSRASRFAFGVLLLILIPLSSFGFTSVPGEVVVRLKDARDLKGLAASLTQKLKLKNVIRTRAFQTDASFALVTVPESEKAASLRHLLQDPRVAYAEPNYVMRLNTNDELYPALWGLKNIGQTDAASQTGRSGSDIGVEPIWAQGMTGSRKIKVAVIDTGVDYLHPDLKDNIWTNPGEIPGNKIDDDGNGFVDDVHGWNFASKGSSSDVPVNPADPADDHYHGTHCAGTIGGVGNNGIGVVGVNWEVTLVPIKFLDFKGSGSLAGAVQSIQYATKVGVDIMSNSWGGGPYTQSLFDVIADAEKAGILFVASAGNDSDDNDFTPSYPASYALDNILSVAATDNKDRLARFSNFGGKAVHVAAPGVQILSTAPAAKGLYKVLSGTSMAAPHVSGIAALMLSSNPSLTATQIKSSLIQTSDPTHALTKKSVSRGRVNIHNALHGIVPPPIPKPDDQLWVDYDWSAESPHPYEENQVYSYPVTVPGAKYLRVVFEKIDTEAKFDYLRVKQANGDEIERLSGEKTQYVTDFLQGDTATLTLETDDTMNKSGFKVAKLQVIY